jgi:hypothetical protein
VSVVVGSLLPNMHCYGFSFTKVLWWSLRELCPRATAAKQQYMG